MRLHLFGPPGLLEPDQNLTCAWQKRPLKLRRLQTPPMRGIVAGVWNSRLPVAREQSEFLCVRLRKWVKFAFGILLLPVCIGASFALFRVVRATGAAQAFWVAFLAGAACWFAVFVLLPRPMLAYVFGHELTHALWTWAFGGRVKKFKASAQGGHVILTKTNFLIALAPYFFPLYAVLVTLIYLGGDLIWNWQPYRAGFHLLLGAAYAFHVTLTWHVLQTRQSDITEQGYVFSAAVIGIGNLFVLLVSVPLLTAQVRLLDAGAAWLEGTARVLRWLARVI